MKIKSWKGIVVAAVLTAGWLVSGQLRAETVLSEGYTLEDFNLLTAADLVGWVSVPSGRATLITRPPWVSATVFSRVAGTTTILFQIP